MSWLGKPAFLLSWMESIRWVLSKVPSPMMSNNQRSYQVVRESSPVRRVSDVCQPSSSEHVKRPMNAFMVRIIFILGDDQFILVNQSQRLH